MVLIFYPIDFLHLAYLLFPTPGLPVVVVTHDLVDGSYTAGDVHAEPRSVVVTQFPVATSRTAGDVQVAAVNVVVTHCVLSSLRTAGGVQLGVEE